jgi:GNAT superfamily N-acetyltransferase
MAASPTPDPQLARQRPRIRLEIARVHRQAWQLFKQHHYLNTDLNPAARCFVAFVVDEAEPSTEYSVLGTQLTLHPAAFTAVLSGPDSRGGYWREHRTVCLPDYQGVGIGNALSEFVASLFVATGKRYCSRTSHPAMIRHRAASKLWKMTGGISFGRKHTGRCAAFNRSAALSRLTAGFRFVGPANTQAARMFAIVKE